MNVISAYMLINKAIPSTGGPYTVRFYDEDGTLIQTDVDIPQGGKAHCTLLDGSINGENQYFKGWNPAPDPVMRDMDCYPVYGDYIISHEEIHDTWEAICRDNGAHYPLLAYKTITIDIPKNTEFTVSYGEQSKLFYLMGKMTVSFHMIKVGEAEDGTTSSWISTGGLDLYNASLSTSPNGGYVSRVTEASGWVGVTAKDWGISDIRQFLEQCVMPALPESVQLAMKQVDKKWQGFVDNQAGTYSDSVIGKSSLDKIWVPSRSELRTIDRTLPIDITNSNKEITIYDGMDYSEIYVPSWSGNAQTRDSCYSWGSNGVHSRWFYAYQDMAKIIKTGAYDRTPFGFCL